MLETCNSQSLAEILNIVKNLLLLIEIVIPVIIFLYIVIGFIRVSIKKEKKKLVKTINKKFILLLIIYLIPIILNITMFIMGNSTSFSSCWNYKKEEVQKEPEKKPVEETVEETEEEEETTNKDGSYVTLEGSNTLAHNIAELAVKVAPVANPNTGFKEEAWLHYGADRAKTNQKMHDYIKIMDATVTKYLNDTNNPNYHVGYNNPAYCSSAGSVGAIIRAAVDPDFDTFNNCAQIEYINNNPKKWIKVGVIKAGDPFDKYAKPGDLLIAEEKDGSDKCVNGHSVIYIGKELAKTRFSNTNGNVFQSTYNATTGGVESTCPAIDNVLKDIRDYTIFRPNEESTSYYEKIDIEKVLSDKMQTGSFW